MAPTPWGSGCFTESTDALATVLGWYAAPMRGVSPSISLGLAMGVAATTSCYTGADAGDGTGTDATTTAGTPTGPGSTVADDTLTTAADSSDGSTDRPDVGVPNQPPVAMFTATPDAGAATLATMLDASASGDPDGTILAYDWEFTDGGAAEGVMVSHDFTAVGCHDVTLTVTDDDGATASAASTLVVAQGAPEVPGTATVDVAPRPSAVLARDVVTDVGTATFHGTVASQGYTHVFAEVRVGEDVRSQTTVPLCGAAPVAFDLAVPIPSELTAFDVHLSLVRDDTRQEFFTVTDLVAGDLYVITGQSNSVAGQVSGDANENQGPFIRSFGSNTTDGNASAADVAWRIADGNGYGGNAIGQWGIRMAALLSAAHETPIGVVNGGLGGQPIGFFQRNDADPTDPATNYGRLLTRLRNGGVDQSLRAILWYQGENDGNASQVHRDGFLALKDDWTEDFAFERIYVTQLRAGCGGDLLGTQEVQRVLADEFAEITVMSTTGLDGHDGCHYTYENGYRELGNHYAGMLARDLYGEAPALDVAPPNPESAALAGGGTQIVITMRNAASALAYTQGAHVDFRVEGAAVAITGGSATGNQITLELAGDASAATGVSYLGHPGAGPWVVNENGVGLLAFANLPLQ